MPDEPEGWLDNDMTGYRYAGYARPMAIWETLDSVSAVHLPGDRGDPNADQRQ
jgi:hypothetical protein